MADESDFFEVLNTKYKVFKENQVCRILVTEEKRVLYKLYRKNSTELPEDWPTEKREMFLKWSRSKYNYETNMNMAVNKADPEHEYTITCYFFSNKNLYLKFKFDSSRVTLYDVYHKNMKNKEFLGLLWINLVTVVKKFHNMGFSHNDLQPGNILYDPKTASVKLIDFETCIQLGETNHITPKWIYQYPRKSELSNTSNDVWALAILYIFLFVDREYVYKISSMESDQHIEFMCGVEKLKEMNIPSRMMEIVSLNVAPKSLDLDYFLTLK